MMMEDDLEMQLKATGAYAMEINSYIDNLMNSKTKSQTSSTSKMKKNKKHSNENANCLNRNGNAISHVNIQVSKASKPSINAQDMMLKLSKDLNILKSDGSSDTKKRSLVSMYKLLFNIHTMPGNGYNQIFQDICKTVFKYFANVTEKNCELAMKITLKFLR
jgi:hypothetical protein